MRIIHWSKSEIVALDDYTNQFHGVIRTNSTVDGLRLEVLLEDNKTPDEIVICTLINVGYNEDDCRNFALSLLANKEHFCKLWEELIERCNDL